MHFSEVHWIEYYLLLTISGYVMFVEKCALFAWFVQSHVYRWRDCSVTTQPVVTQEEIMKWKVWGETSVGATNNEACDCEIYIIHLWIVAVVRWNVLARTDSVCQMVRRKQKESKSTTWQLFAKWCCFIYMCSHVWRPPCHPDIGSCANLCPLFSAGSWLLWFGTPVAPSMLLSYLKGNSAHFTGLGEYYFICEDMCLVSCGSRGSCMSSDKLPPGMALGDYGALWVIPVYTVPGQIRLIFNDFFTP